MVAQGHRLAVLAIDPSARAQQGRILGDKTRMEKLSAMQQVYIMAVAQQRRAGRDNAQHLAESILLCEAAGLITLLLKR